MWVRLFQIAPRSSLCFRYLQAPSGVVGVIYRGFNLLHRSLLKRFPLFLWLLFAGSSVSHFRPDTGGRRWSLVQVAGSVALRGGTCAAFPSTLLRPPAVLYGACPALRAVPALGCSTKARNKKLHLCFLPSPPERLRQPGASPVYSPRVREPSALRVPSPSPRPPRSGACALCLAATLPADVDHPESKEVFG